MNTPLVTAEASLYMSAGSYQALPLFGASANRVVPAIPACQNCDFICDVCIRTGRVCGACRFCLRGICDPNSPL